MKFLIDECLHPSLVAVLQAGGHEAYHVSHLGLSSMKDHALMVRIVEGDFVFVTNNAVDFRRLYRRHGLHAGLVVVVQQVAPARQRSLMIALLQEPAVGGEPVNEAIEVRIHGDAVVFDRYDWPSPE